MAGMADDVMNRLASLSTDRLSIETTWEQVAVVGAPEASDFRHNYMVTQTNASVIGKKSPSAESSKKRYDSTAVNAVDRLASGIVGLVIPDNERWHNLGYEGFKYRVSHQEQVHLDSVRDFLFETRYDADSGFVAATQTAMRRMCAFGTGLFMVEEGADSRALINYRYMPVQESYIADDALGRIDTILRPYRLTHRQAVQRFGSRVSPNVMKLAEDPKRMDESRMYVHQISPRGDFGRPMDSLITETAYGSIHIDSVDRIVVKDSGFHEFPIFDFRWLPEPGSPYPDSPLMKCLAEVQSLQVQARNELLASDQAVNPPLLVANAGLVNRPSNRPGAMTLGGIGPNGQRLVEELFRGQRLDFATVVLQAKREQVKESMYINLFALLVQNPRMSATEALIRQGEKGELLGPAGTRLQETLSRLIEREHNIMVRRGLYEPGSLYVPPRRSAANNGARPKPAFNNPLSKLRKSREVEGTLRVLEVMAPLLNVDQDAARALDADEMLRGIGEVSGMPARFFKSREQVAAEAQQRAEAQQAQQAVAVAEQAASAGKLGGDALARLQEAGL